MIESSSYVKHTGKRLNRRKAIRWKCVDCSAGSYSEVRNCTFTDCPLHPYRSGQGKQNPKLRSKLIRAYCLWCMGDQIGEVWNCHLNECTLWSYRKYKTDTLTETTVVAKN
jgi:hypothetical protein